MHYISVAKQTTLFNFVVTAFFAVSLLLAVMPAPARAASLTETQIQAILTLLVSFDVDETTISNVDGILHNKSNSGAPTTTTAPSTSNSAPTATTSVTPTCTLDANKSTAVPGDQITLTWKSAGATYSSSPNGNTGPSGVVIVTPSETTIYQKTVYGPGGSAKCQVIITVSPLQTVAPPAMTAPIPTNAIKTQVVMSQSEINVASVALAIAQFPFAIAINSLTDIFFEFSIGQ